MEKKLQGRFVNHMGHTAWHSENKTCQLRRRVTDDSGATQQCCHLQSSAGCSLPWHSEYSRLKGMRDHHPGQSGPLSLQRSQGNITLLGDGWLLGFPKDFQEYANNIPKLWYIFIGHS